MNNVSDYIAEFLVKIECTTVHGLMGGGAAGLNDGFINNNELSYLCYHHEQGAGYAALGEARLTGRWGILNPTTGCAGTNCYTPVLNAWQDSIPLAVISGNVNIETLSSSWYENHNIKVRTYGVQENDIISSISSITKYSKLVKRAEDIGKIMSEAFFQAAVGRKGPVWIDVPADVQQTQIEPKLFKNISKVVKSLKSRIEQEQFNHFDSVVCSEIIDRLRQSKRPLILIGGGVSNDSKEKKIVNDFVLKHNIPTVATYAGTNVISHDSSLYLGAIGIKGNRSANFALQNCDLLLVLGSRLPYAAIGYDVKNFACNADICVIDIDQNEMQKNNITFPKKLLQMKGKAGSFCNTAMVEKYDFSNDWLKRCEESKYAWDIIKENKKHFNYDGISIYHVMEELNSSEYDECNFVVDAGSISYVAPTALKYTHSRNFIYSPAQADMGCALPSSIGVAAKSAQRTICVTGDGSLMSNLQELASVGQNCDFLTIILLNNGGYLSITNTQRNNYGENRVFGEHDGRGLNFPDYKKLCDAFSLRFAHVQNLKDLSVLQDEKIQFVQIDCLRLETIAPYQAKVNGIQAGAHNMAPFLDQEELMSYASVPFNFEK